MSNPDRVSLELRKIEKEIDNYYKSNPLLNLPYATAAWSFMAFVENWIWDQVNQELTSQELGILVDNVVNEMKDPMLWLFNNCKPGGNFPCNNDKDILAASRDLLRLGKKYGWFAAAYTYASRGWVELELQDSIIQPKDKFFKDIEYQAYGRLIKAHEIDEAASLIDPDRSYLLWETIGQSVKVIGDRFKYQMNPQIVSDVTSTINTGYDVAFPLPEEWEFGSYSLGDFRRAFEAILAMADIHWRARRIAIEKGCQNNAYLDSIYLPTCTELLRRVSRYSGLPDNKVQSIIDDLTYGNRGIKHPDLALQPLIKMNSEYYAIMPQLWLSLSPERNLTILLNKICDERRIYLELVNEKETLMRKHIISELCDDKIRFDWGNVANLPDIDLAIVNDSEKICLLLELKWFIAPAEFGEVVEKSEDIEKGISQSLQLKQAFANNCDPLLRKLRIDSSYRFETVVVTQNWIGYANVQSPEVPIIRADHLLAKLKVTDSLLSSIVWLKDRKYLPTEGVDFEKQGVTSTIGNWTVKWTTTRPLISDVFFPL